MRIEYHRTLIADRMRRGRQQKYRAGVLLPWTRPPYGYRLGADRPHPLPTFDMGPPLETILENCLDETGLPAPRAPIPR